MKNPCRDCSEKSIFIGEERCRIYYCCSDYIEWQVEVAWKVEHEREADPQEERGLDYMIDDREC